LQVDAAVSRVQEVDVVVQAVVVVAVVAGAAEPGYSPRMRTFCRELLRPMSRFR
jgi:hypothetical protein